MNRWLMLGLLCALGVSLVLRCPFLDERPMHNDEAVNGIKFGRLWEQGVYKYDPEEHHGPSLYYATLVLGRLTAAPDIDHFSETRLRMVTVLFSLGLILLLPLIADGLGRRATIWAGLFTAVSPAMVFYSRYYIHEMLLVFFTFLGFAASWRYWRSRRMGWALLAGAAIGLMDATKETFIITLAAAALGLGCNAIWNRWLDASRPAVRSSRLNGRHLAAGAGIWLLVALVLFTSFFTNPHGPWDSLRTYGPWIGRAGGNSPHIHPWYFYFQRLLYFHIAKGPVWSEGIVFILALAGAIAGFARKPLAEADAGFVRFLALYTFGLTAAYTLISYKTPWCLLSFWHGMILLAGSGVVFLSRCLRRQSARWGLGLVILAGLSHLGWQAWQAGVTYAADRRNPYVYAQTSADLLELVSRVREISKASAQGRDMLVKVIAPDGDYWPLPWYLRALRQVGWWEALPADPFAPVMIVSSVLQAHLDEKQTHQMVGFFQLRPGVFFELYVQRELWNAYLAKGGASAEGANR